MKYLLIGLFLGLVSCNQVVKEHAVSGEAQGTTYTVKYIQTNEEVSLKSELDSLLLSIDSSMSTYKPSSLISSLNAGERIEMDLMFQDVFYRSNEINSITDGAFDPTIGPLISAWGFNFESPLKLDSAMIDSLKQLCGFNHFMVEKPFLKLLNPEASLNFNAIAQGYSVDLMAKLLDAKGIKNYYVELGGELKVKGKNKEEKLWRIGIDKPKGENLARNLSHIIPLNNKAMATSGNYRKFYEIDGVKYSHTINPKTGFPVKHNLLSATVIANNCMDADAFGTSFMVLGLDKSIEILNENPNLDAILIYSEGEELKSYYTPNIENSVIELD